MRSDNFDCWDLVISPNHNEILMDEASQARVEPARPDFDPTDLLTDWRIAASHNEILTAGDPSDIR
jgi:hypothetical protein